MKTVNVELYQFDELSDKAKEVARDWFKNGYPDHDWWESVYEDAKEAATRLGIEIDKIYFSGFWSQGDGACFTGTFRGKNLKTLDEMKSEYPTEEGLHVLLQRLLAVKHDEESLLEIFARGHYSHSGTMSVNDANALYAPEEEKEVLNCLRHFADWIYKSLEESYKYLVSNECVDADIRANEYWFLVDGSRSTLGD